MMGHCRKRLSLSAVHILRSRCFGADASMCEESNPLLIGEDIFKVFVMSVRYQHGLFSVLHILLVVLVERICLKIKTLRLW